MQLFLVSSAKFSKGKIQPTVSKGHSSPKPLLSSNIISLSETPYDTPEGGISAEALKQVVRALFGREILEAKTPSNSKINWPPDSWKSTPQGQILLPSDHFHSKDSLGFSKL
jgi:hypothetical protein